MISTMNKKYFMEDPREKQRLADKVDPSDWVKRYIQPLAVSSCKVLDVGCGPGILAREVAKTADLVVGLEQSDDRFPAATESLESLPNARAIQGDATDMPLESNQFDLAYTRFMLEYLKNPGAAIAEMVRVCRPGGQVLLQDLDGQLSWHYPMEEKLARKIQQVVDGLAATGFDPFIGRKLFHMARTAGLQNIQVQCEPYHLYAGRIDETNDQLWDLKLEIALPNIARIVGDEGQALRLKAEFMDYLRRDDTLTYSNVFTIVGTVC